MKLLFVGDSHTLCTGFGTYHKEILTRLHATGNYQLAEIGAFQDANPPWTFYSTQDQQARSPHDQFGYYKFDGIIKEFQPDWVISHYDPWMFSFIESSSLRNTYRTLLIPAVDAIPMPEAALQPLRTADVVCAVSHYAKDYLQGCDIPIRSVLSNGVDMDVYHPRERPKDAFILGTVMRNQKRKQFPLLFQMFENLWLQHPHIKLLCHTTWPDPYGWDIPKLLRNLKSRQSVLFTRKCWSCHTPSNDTIETLDEQGISICKHCKGLSAYLPQLKDGYTQSQLADVYNIMDIYIQLSRKEGFCMPIAEAKACGVPVVCPDHTALSEHLRRGGAVGVSQVSTLIQDASLRNELGKQALRCAQKHHSWGPTIEKLEQDIRRIC